MIERWDCIRKILLQDGKSSERKMPLMRPIEVVKHKFVGGWVLEAFGQRNEVLAKWWWGLGLRKNLCGEESVFQSVLRMSRIGFQIKFLSIRC